MNLEILSTRPAPELVDERMLGIEHGRGEGVCIGHLHLGQFE